MPRSTASFISYDLRPAKQAERRILIDVLSSATGALMPVRKYRYIGMGANRFYDFLLLHKYLGISDMVSLEHDPVMFERAMLNRPYDFVSVLNATAADWIAADPLMEPAIVWFDYDGGLGQRLISDISDLALKTKPLDFFFVTVYGGPPKAIDNKNDADRLIWLQETFGDLAGEVVREDCQKKNFHRVVHKVLTAAFKSAYAMRPEGRFYPLLQVLYEDSKPMVTVGGALLTSGQAEPIKQALAADLPFLSASQTELFEIESFALTERERAIFDLAATKKRRNSPEMNVLKRLGFEVSDVLAYRRLLRYIPRYVETMI